MPDIRKHRGPHPADDELFRPSTWPVLQQAVEHLSWLFTRGYAEASSLKLVGDRFHLTKRQRTAVLRSSCSDQSLRIRRQSQVAFEEIAGERLAIDGFNLLTTIEAALSGGILLHARDDCYRDLAGMHGSYRKVQETLPALQLIGEALANGQVAECRWYLDQPVSNSGRLSRLIREMADQHNWNWHVELVADPDAVLIEAEQVVISADSGILDRCKQWCNVAGEVVDRLIPAATIVPMNH